MLKLAVSGKPIKHSQSPEIFKSLGYRSIFDKIETNSPEKLLTYLKKNNYLGCNITAPLKETVIPFLDHLDKVSQAIGAVNTIKIENGKTFGFNTDPVGIFESLKDYSLNHSKALVLGSGGASKSAIYALQVLKCQINICGRNEDAALKIKQHFQIDQVPWGHLLDSIANFDLIVSTLPSLLDLPFDLPITKKQTLLDANYKDAYIEKYPHRINGLIWLKAQAKASFDLYNQNIQVNDPNSLFSSTLVILN